MLDREEKKTRASRMCICVCLQRDNMNVCGLCVEVKSSASRRVLSDHCLVPGSLDLQRVT